MNKIICMALLCLLTSVCCKAQKIYFPRLNDNDSVVTAKRISVLAEEALKKFKLSDDREGSLATLVKLQLAAGRYEEAITTIKNLRDASLSKAEKYPGLRYVQFELFLKAKRTQLLSDANFEENFSDRVRDLFKKLDDKSALYISTAFLTRNGIRELRDNFNGYISSLKSDSIELQKAIEICNAYSLFKVFSAIEPIAKRLLKEDDEKRYLIQDSVYIKTNDGAILSAVVVCKKGIEKPLPAALMFFIYSNLDRSLAEAKYSAASGYVGIVADTRGKRLSPDTIEPYEHEYADVNAVINWITKQKWSDGRVGMYGGSYSGFAQWAATKHTNKALKTIVPYVAAIPGQGLPMENNVFLNANYQWAFYVTDNKYTDDAVNNDNARWRRLRNNWYASGAAYDKIDSIDGTPNPWLQKWLKHPSYDKYWQAMVPYKTDFVRINIPVLTFEGYYDDGQISGLHYLLEHYKYNPKANHYLIIGPYDHFGTQRGGDPILRGYQVDPVALIDTKDITFQWFDFIFKNGKKPDILKDRINYEVMGSNEWKHVPSIPAMSNKTLRLYLTNLRSDSNYLMTSVKPKKAASIYQSVDLSDRTTTNNDYYPFPIIKDQLDRSNGLFFISQPFDKPTEVSGLFRGELKTVINKKDMDIGVVLYEVMPDGRYVELSYYLGRASYARQIETRQLLRPGTKEIIPFTRTRLVSRLLHKGSRLMIVLNIDKNPFAEINYGTGKQVSEESIKDAGEPLKIWWMNDSYVDISLKQ
ncbi:MAG TPA: CocE/NonD family hydrolase [Mucilaginibacter sp.]|nr:CocE/NonD family hydrolase [Mucilaginibacter sp.]